VATWLVVGLGNPGSAYAATRHNVGRLVVEELADRVRDSSATAWRRHRTGRADTVEARLGTPGDADAPRVVFLRPRTFMNESGGPVASVAAYLRVPADHVVVAHDEIDLPFGRLRLKRGGGDNGHNGVRSMRTSLRSGDFSRLRVGIGRPPGSQDPADFVLSTWSAAERRELPDLVTRAADAVDSLLHSGLEQAQNVFNG